jgi:hypothetical protein
VANPGALVRSNANSSNDRFVSASNTDFISGTPFEQSRLCGRFSPFDRPRSENLTVYTAIAPIY